MKVEDISIREIFTADFRRTVEVSVKAQDFLVRTPVPTFKSDKFNHLHTTGYIEKFGEVKRYFVKSQFDSMDEVDDAIKEIDPTKVFEKIGGGMAYALSATLLKALAKSQNVEIYEMVGKRRSDIPVPMGVMLTKRRQRIDVDEMMMHPTKRGFTKGLMKLNSVYHNLEAGKHMTVHSALKLLSKFTQLNLTIGVRFGVGYDKMDGVYVYEKENLGTQEQLLFVQDILKDYPVDYVEDPFHDEDYILPATLTRRIPSRIVAGNGLYGNDLDRLETGIDLKSTSGIVVTPHEVGTINDLVELIELAKKSKIAVIMSCINNVNDSLPAHLALGLRSEFAKFAFDGSSTEKMNELVMIEENM